MAGTGAQRSIQLPSAEKTRSRGMERFRDYPGKAAGDIVAAVKIGRPAVRPVILHRGKSSVGNVFGPQHDGVVVDGFAPGILALELETVAQPPLEVQVQCVEVRIELAGPVGDLLK